MLESKIQTKIKKELTKQGWIVLRPVQVSKSGYPDLWCLKDCQCMFVEVKRPGENPTPLQELRHKELREAGFQVIIATSVNCVERIKSAHAFSGL